MGSARPRSRSRSRIEEVTGAQVTDRNLRRYVDESEQAIRRFLLTRAGVAAGLLEIEVGEKKFEVSKIAVVPKFRGTGVGRELLAFAEAEAKRQRRAVVSLRAHSMDPRAMTTSDLERWYLRSGYEHVFGPGFLHALRKRL